MESIYKKSMLQDPPISSHGCLKVPGYPSNVTFVETGSRGGGGEGVGRRDKEIGNVIGGILGASPPPISKLRAQAHFGDLSFSVPKCVRERERTHAHVCMTLNR